MKSKKHIRKKPGSSEAINEKDVFKLPKDRSMTYALVFLILGTLITAGILVFYQQRGEEAQKDVAAIVNGEVITIAKVNQAHDELLMRYGQHGELITKEMALENSIDELLIMQEIEKKGLTASQQEISDAIDELKMQLAFSGMDFDEWMQLEGIDMDFLEDALSLQVKYSKLFEILFSDITVTESELIEFYNNNKEEFFMPDMVRASHILVDSREEAKSLIERIGQGEDFAGLAMQFSTCPSGQNGGDLDYFQRGQMVKEFEDAAFALEPGSISEIVETDFGYHIIKVTDKKQEGIASFEEARESLEYYLYSDLQQNAYLEYIESLRGKADIQIFMS